MNNNDRYEVIIPVKDDKKLELFVPDIACKIHVDQAIAILKGIQENLRDKPKMEYNKKETK